MASASDPAGRPRLALATCAEVAELDEEGRLLLAALREGGIEAEPAVWDDPAVEWDRYRRVLLRSTWDYPDAPERFLGWARERGERLLNPLAAVEWNISKRYLPELEAWGIPIVPTRVIAAGASPRLDPDGEGELVVKPAISAGSRGTARYGAGEGGRATAHARSLLEEGREVLVQPYLDSVDTAAETAIVVLGGEVTHAMSKQALLAPRQGLEQGLFRQEQMAPRRARPEQIELAREVVSRFSAEVRAPLYARVDLLDGDDGAPRLLELELIEPSLFLDHDEAALRRLVALLRERL